MDGCDRYGIEISDSHIVSGAGADTEYGKICMKKNDRSRRIANGHIPAFFYHGLRRVFGVR